MECKKREIKKKESSISTLEAIMQEEITFQDEDIFWHLITHNAVRAVKNGGQMSSMRKPMMAEEILMHLKQHYPGAFHNLLIPLQGNGIVSLLHFSPRNPIKLRNI